MTEHPIKNAPGFVRDEKSGAILNNNTSDYNLILEKRKHKAELDEVNSKLAKLETIMGKLLNDRSSNINQ